MLLKHSFWQQEQQILKVLSSLSYRTGEIGGYLHEIASGVSRLIHSDWSIVTLCQDGKGEVIASSLGLGDGDHGFSAHGTLVGEVTQTGQVLFIEDVRLEAPERAKPPEPYLCYLGVPLQTPQGIYIGTICSFFREPHHFADEQIRLVKIFAERAATAIDNYQLYQQQQKFNETLEAEVVKRTVELRSTQAKLMELNIQLEQRVKERTLDLIQANQQLEAEIAERKRAEEVLGQSEERLRQLAENMEQVFWMISLDKDAVYVSPAFERIWGYSCDRWYKDPELWWKVIHPDDQERVRQAFNQNQSVKYDAEYQIIRPDGTIRIIRDQSFPIRDATGKIHRIAGIAEDITERRQLEQERLKAIAALAEIGELASMIVHEIRNPLTTILMGLTSCQRLELPESVNERITLSLEEGERLRLLLNEILLFAKPHQLQLTTIDLNAFVAEVINSIQTMPAAIKRKIQLSPASMAVHVSVDKAKLKQVLINLIDNACEAIAEGETVICRIEQFNEQVYIRVCNRGEPISPDDLQKLTKPFYTTKSSGTGLGLAIVKRIVDAHAGEFLIESSLEQGTIASVGLKYQPG